MFGFKIFSVANPCSKATYQGLLVLRYCTVCCPCFEPVLCYCTMPLFWGKGRFTVLAGASTSSDQIAWIYLREVACTRASCVCFMHQYAIVLGWGKAVWSWL